jgi:hypothetical protein
MTLADGEGELASRVVHVVGAGIRNLQVKKRYKTKPYASVLMCKCLDVWTATADVT